MYSRRFPLDMLDLRLPIKSYLTKKGRTVPYFKSNIPVEDCVPVFMKRNNLTNRLSTNIKKTLPEISKDNL